MVRLLLGGQAHNLGLTLRRDDGLPPSAWSIVLDTLAAFLQEPVLPAPVARAAGWIIYYLSSRNPTPASGRSRRIP
jgi:hypothetical protein